MSKHNYSQYSNKKPSDKPKEEETATVVESENPIDTVNEPVAIEKATEIKMETPKPKTAAGIVANCSKLNIRSEPSTDGDVVSVLAVGSEVKINLPESNKGWFKVCTATGVDGYCMRKFVNVQP